MPYISKAKKITVGGIQFKSFLEGDFYKKCLDLNLPFQYESQTFQLLSKIPNPTFTYYKKWGKNFIKSGASVDNMEYTPDFIWDTGKYLFIVECKGNPNESYPVRKRVFFDMIQKWDREVYFFEPRRKKDNTKVLEIVTDLI